MGKETLNGRNLDSVGNFTVCIKVFYIVCGLGMNASVLTTNL